MPNPEPPPVLSLWERDGKSRLVVEAGPDAVRYHDDDYHVRWIRTDHWRAWASRAVRVDGEGERG